ncbi:MAG: cysteine--tRNA ligase [Candidatus Nealsonbacteria bacterium]|nr:cysteine--tRNA ligase [Candidatus Nealsonbacteria bacterium]
MKIYNTLSRKKETLKPLDNARGKKLKLFVCGPTVYDSAHIGHARTYLAFDMIVKYLKEKDYDVFYLQNITDLDDKIINRARESKIFWKDLTKKFEKAYLQDMKALKINSVSKYARATDYIKEIIGQTKKLLKKEFAYQIEDGVYYNISKFKDYGKLSHRTVLQAEDAVSRIDEAKDKRNKGDFALWKFSKSDEPSWSSPWGQGRPGWHIEDTAITEKFFGAQYDIHGGARDLIFPHHEAEISQMEAISGKKPLAKYWLHTGFLTVNNQKMSKSLGNFITINDFINKHSARVLRFLVLKNHYRSPIDYSENAVLQAKRELERIDEFVGYLGCPTSPKIKGDVGHPDIKQFQKRFEAAMEDDFNAPKAVAVIFELMRQRDVLNAKDVLEFLKQIDKFFNFIFWPKVKEKIPQEIINLAEKRENYRKEKNWQKADEIRKEMTKLGWLAEDAKEGPNLKKIK